MKKIVLLMIAALSTTYAATCDLTQSSTKELDLKTVKLDQTNIMYGRIAAFNYRSTIEYNQKVLYYIPSSLGRNTKGAASAIFMHGGGASTGGLPDGSLNVAMSYLRDLVKISERLKTIIYMPVSPLNWGWNTMFVTKEIAQISHVFLKTDSNKSVLMGHSMGGMGIGRSSMYVVDSFAGLMPLSSGVTDENLTPIRLKTYLNTSVRRQVGIYDHFDFFLKSSVKEEELVNKLARDFNVTENHQTLVYNGTHNYELDLVQKDLKDILENSPRNLYQKKLFPVFYNSKQKAEIYQWKDLSLHNVSRYFWLEAVKYGAIEGGVASALSSANAEVENNKYSINFIDKTNVKKLRVFLSEKMIDFNRPVRIEINGKIVFNEMINKSQRKEDEITNYMKDDAFKFENCVDLEI